MKFLTGAILAVVLLMTGLSIAMAKSPQASMPKHLPLLEAVAAEDADAFLGCLHEGVVEQIDRPVLTTWMKAMNEAVGACQYTIAGADHLHRVSYSTQGRKVESHISIQYDKGVVDSKITTLNNEIISFHIGSDQLAGDWFDGPESGLLYIQRSEKFLVGLLEGRYDDIEPMMHEGLVEVAPRDELIRIQGLVREMVGQWESFDVLGGELSVEDGVTELNLEFEIAGSEGNVRATTRFAFGGLKGHLMAFNYAPIVTEEVESVADESEAGESPIEQGSIASVD
ncbi:MAG: hypothetical protein AAGJ40_08975 [Planctomycetota bacterium]